jgi:hypothetical protein
MQPYARLISLAATLALTGSVSAQGPAKDKGPARTVQMFNIFCLSQLPDLEGVKRAAGFGEFAQITGEELEQYQPTVRAEELHAWSFAEKDARYVLTAVRTRPDEDFKKAVPAFAGSIHVGCSLLFPTSGPREALYREIAGLLGREADETWEEGAMRVHAWSARKDKHLSHVHYFTPAAEGPTSILRARVFVKD